MFDVSQKNRMHCCQFRINVFKKSEVYVSIILPLSSFSRKKFETKTKWNDLLANLFLPFNINCIMGLIFSQISNFLYCT